MHKTNKKQAFSMAEAMILVTMLAVAVASAAPFFTKKAVNVTEAGAT